VQEKEFEKKREEEEAGTKNGRSVRNTKPHKSFEKKHKR